MVKFRAGSEASSAVARASRASPPDFGILAPVADALSARVQTPLRVKQLSGGDWVVLAVDLDRLAEQTTAKLHARPGVAAVQPGGGEASGVGNPLAPVLAVTFQPAAPESKAIEESLSGASTDQLERVARELGRDLSVPLKAKAEKTGQVLLTIDLPALTATLAERLQAQTSLIEATQLNYVSDFR